MEDLTKFDRLEGEDATEGKWEENVQPPMDRSSLSFRFECFSKASLVQSNDNGIE